MPKTAPALKIGMIVFPKGLITPQLYRISDANGTVVDLTPMSLGAVPMQSPTHDLRRYRIRSTDEVSWNDHIVEVVRVTNPLSDDIYQYEVQAGEKTVTVPEYELNVHEGSLAPEPADMLGQLDLAPWKLVSARACLVEAFFNATARSMGIVGYNGARMLPIPHQINAARYALQFGRPRFILADEVGLGKTIETGLIVSTLRKYFPEWDTAIFVPESLTAQWAFEMYGKFGKTIFALTEDEDDEDAGAGVILPHHRAKAYAVRNKPEILVVDEAHRILRDERLLQAYIRLSKSAHAVLLLTATPVSDDSMNLLRLFQILDPEVYGSLKKPEDLKALQQVEAKIEEFLRAVREPDPDESKVVKAWKATKLKDEEITALLGQVRHDREGRHALHRAASLVVDRYYPGSRLLRYRRKFLEQDSPLPFRIVDGVEYKPTDEELAVIEVMNKWLGLIRDNNLSEDIHAQRVAASLMQSAHSSPLALEQWIAARRGELERHAGVTADPILLSMDAMGELDFLHGENDVLEELATVCEKWKRATRAIEATSRQLARSGRYMAFIDFLKQTFQDDPDSHLLVFTSFEANVHPLYLLLRKALTDLAEVFEMTALQSRVEREKNAFEFQEFLGGSVLISDELGGEGRNFQFATHVVHFDLPYAPWMVEQRIGRCDRVGRSEEMDVDSQVLVAKGQLDEAFFDFLTDGVGVFNESIAPVEGELDRIMTRALKACIDEGATGVLELIDEVSEYLEEAKERENAELLVRDRVGVEEARRISAELQDDEQLQELRRHAIQYARLFESMVDERKTGQVSVTVGEFHSLHSIPGVSAEMIGFFDRKHAVRHERQEFFSTGHPFLRSLTQLAMTESPDRASIVKRKGVKEPCMLFTFRISLPGEFFEAVRSLDVELQPPLLSKSARLFATKIERVVLTLDAEQLEYDKSKPFANGESLDDDICLYEDKSIDSLLPDDWHTLSLRLANEAREIIDDLLAETLPARRDEFEDLACEVFTRVNPSHDLIEPEIEAIMEPLEELQVELESVVVFLPG